ncbi:hypothetical protein K458DRAFT_426127 [Lentithecium fluviatile CBS 122367]|uniref:Secreted protein n=1 Tax=Lentithecium fluviatile CBS 122367 TaxID=1168545 RepID=A0A6G1JJD4_9PLEO|nr:hypothetical protein K458DRAFT_426127 [Lentithecium fluviatile CBS 122367]
MLPIQRIIEIVLAFVLWAEVAASSLQTVVMSLLQHTPKAPSNYNAVQRLHSRIDRKMHTYSAHRRQATNSASAIRMLRAQAARPHPNMWRAMKVH